jgi:predicted dehydrogenase
MKFGVIGYGYWGPNIVRNLAQLEGSQVLAIAEISPQARLRAQKAHPGVKIVSNATEVLSSTEIDAIAVVSPPWKTESMFSLRSPSQVRRLRAKS